MVDVGRSLSKMASPKKARSARAASPKKAKAKSKTKPQAKAYVHFESHEQNSAADLGPAETVATGESLASRIARRRLERSETPRGAETPRAFSERDHPPSPEHAAAAARLPTGMAGGGAPSSSETLYEMNVPWLDVEGKRNVKPEWLEEQARLTKALNRQYGLGDETSEDEDEDLLAHYDADAEAERQIERKLELLRVESAPAQGMKPSDAPRAQPQQPAAGAAAAAAAAAAVEGQQPAASSFEPYFEPFMFGGSRTDAAPAFEPVCIVLPDRPGDLPAGDGPAAIAIS